MIKDTGFDVLFGLASFVIGVLWISWIAGILYLGYVVINQDWSEGIRPVIERVWCGEPGCLNKPK